jgi:hypothetical protein
MGSERKQRDRAVRSFSDISDQLGLRRLGVVDVGVVYFVPYRPGGPCVIVRHFEGREQTMVQPYAKLIESVAEWIADREQVAHTVRVEPALEIGRDFYARRDYPYLTSVRSYTFGDLSSEPPPELQEMRALVAFHLPHASAQSVVERVVRRSLLEPTHGTFFLESKSTFLVLDPAITGEDLTVFERSPE